MVLRYFVTADTGVVPTVWKRRCSRKESEIVENLFCRSRSRLEVSNDTRYNVTVRPQPLGGPRARVFPARNFFTARSPLVTCVCCLVPFDDARVETIATLAFLSH